MNGGRDAQEFIQEDLGPIFLTLREPARLPLALTFGASATCSEHLIESAYFFGPRASSNFVRTPAHAWATLLLGSVASGMVANPAFFT